MTTTAAPATIAPISDAEFGALAMVVLSKTLKQTSPPAAGDSVFEMPDGSVNATWPDDCVVHVRKESPLSRVVTVECALGLELGEWLLAKSGYRVFTMTERYSQDCVFQTTIYDEDTLEAAVRELVEMRAACSSGVAPEETLAYDFGAMRMDMD
jgi:hypothetical protein